MINSVIGLFFLMNASSGELVQEPVLIPFKTYDECEQTMAAIKIDIARQYVDTKVLGVCIPGESIR